MSIDPNQVKAVFLQAIEQCAPGQWGDFLEATCAGNDDLRRRVEVLLEAHLGKDSLFDGQPDAAPPTIDQTVTEKVGTQIGPYKLLQQIGEGGFGVVYMAEQTEPVRRKVALKVIKPGMDTRQVIARFEAERQALAVMDHPHIAKVLDAGTTGEGSSRSRQTSGETGTLASSATGRPYFVMELVRGIPITQYCDENQLPIRERLELFATICQAIQHAHTKGIIHRDIKPTNVLVTRQDGQPVVKVIDFGVAKAMGQALTDKTLFTEFAQMIGTPLYMSPEQAELSSTDIDTRSDVYSLGVLLYELLTGSTPVSKEQLKQAAFDEIRRIIREDEPQKPSTRISTAESAPSIAAQRHTEPAKLAKLVRGELDWIVMKALEKDRNRRYETASGFARDVQRYLNDEQVQACPPSAAYRFRKFARRNKGALAIVCVATLAILLALVGLTVSNVLITQEKNLKVAALQTAKNNEQAANTQKGIAERNAIKAREEEQKAAANEKKAKASELLARRRFYAAQMNLAQQAWEAGQPARALELLESQRPKVDQEDMRGFDWYYLWRLCHRHLDRILSGPYGEVVYSVAITPDGKTLVSGSTDASVRVWDVATGKERAVLTGHRAPIWRVAISPSGKLAASASMDSTVKLWDLETSELLATLADRSQMARSVAFSPDGKVIAVGTEDGALELWDVETRKRRLMLQASSAPTVALAYSPDGKMLATGSGWDTIRGKGGVKVWDMTNDPPRVVFAAPHSLFAAFSPDSKLLATCAWGGVSVLSATSGELKARFEAAGTESVAFSADAGTLVVGSRDRTVKLCDLASGAARIVGVHQSAVYAVAFLPQGNLFASGGADGAVKIWHVDPAPDSIVYSHDSAIRSLAFAPDSKLLVAGSDSATKLLDAATGKETTALPVNRVLATAADANVLATWAPDDKRVIWDVAAARERAVLPVGPEFAGLALSRDGRLVVTWSTNSEAPERAVRLWDVATSRVRVTLKLEHFGKIMCAAISPDDKTVATAHQFGTITLWDAATGQERMTLWREESKLLAAHVVAFSNDGRLLAAGNHEGILRLWNVETGQLQVSFKGHTEQIMSLAFSPDNMTLLSGGVDKTARLWDTVTGQELLTLKDHKFPVHLVAFAPDGKRLATASHNQVRLCLAAAQPQAAALRVELDPDDPDSPRAANNWGDRLLDTDQPQEAEKVYRKAQSRLEKLVAALPDAPDYRDELAYSLLAPSLMADPPPTAAQSRAQFAEIWRGLPADRQIRLGRRLLDRGSELKDAGRLPEAVKVLEQVTALIPSNVVAWHQLGYTLDLSGQSEKAIEAYSRAIEVDPKNAASWNNRGVLYNKLRQSDKAIADYRQAIALNPSNSILVSNLGTDLRRQGKLDDAIAILRQGLEALGPDDPDALKIQIQLADLYRIQSNLPEEIRLLAQIRDQYVKSLGPSDATTLASMNQLAAAYWRNKQLDRSIPLLEETVRLNRAERPPDDPETYTSIANLGVNYRDAGWSEDALPLLEEVVEWARKQPAPVASQFAWVTAALAESYEQSHQFAKAEALHRQAVEQARQQFGAADPRTAGPLASLCRNLLLQQKYAEAEPLARECLALREKAQPDLWSTFNAKSMLGGTLVGQKRYAEAEPMLLTGYEGMKQRAATMPPNVRPRLAEAVERLIQLYEDSGQPERAAQWRKILEEDHAGATGGDKPLVRLLPKSATLQLQLGNALMKQGKLDEAAMAFRQAIDVCPSDSSILRRLTLNLLDLKKLDQARTRLERAAEQNPSAISAYLILGTVLLDHQKHDEAIACYRRAIELEPNNAAAYYQAGATLLERAVDPPAVDEAAAFLEKGVELDPKHVECRWRLGRARHRQKRLDDAVICFRACLEANPNHFNSHWGLGFVLLDQHQPTDAVASMRQAVALNPNNAYVQYGLGRALSELKEHPEEAIAAFRKSIELDPKPYYVHFQLGLLLREQNQPDEALVCFRKTIELNPENPPAHGLAGSILAIQGKTAEGVASMRKAIELDPKLDWSHAELAWQLATAADPKVRDPQAAVDHARKATDLQPKEPIHWRNLGVALLRTGDNKAAAEALEKFDQMTNSSVHDHRFFLAMAYWQLGERDKARQAYERAVEWMDENQPDDEQLRRFRLEAAELLELKKKQD